MSGFRTICSINSLLCPSISDAAPFSLAQHQLQVPSPNPEDPVENLHQQGGDHRKRQHRQRESEKGFKQRQHCSVL